MLKLDNNLLYELGLGSLPEEQKRAMLQHIYETLELRVGTNLANQMTDQQLEEFEKFIDEGGDANQSQALQWLEANLPNYKQVVNDVFEQLKGEVRQMAPQIMASSSATPNTQVAQQPQMAPQQQGYPTQPMQQPQAGVPQGYGQPAQPQYAPPAQYIQQQQYAPPQQPAPQGFQPQAPQQPYPQQPPAGTTQQQYPSQYPGQN